MSGLLATAVFLVGAVTLEAEAVPMRVRARTAMEVKLVRDDGGIRLIGLLKDESGAGVPSRDIHVNVHGMVPPGLATKPDGTYEVLIESTHLQRLEEREGRLLPWSVAFDGDGAYGASSTSGNMDLLREPTWIKLEVSPQPIQVGIDEMRIAASVFAGEEPLPAQRIELRIDDGPSLGGLADEDGVAVFVVRALDLLRSGSMKIRAQFKGSERYDVAEGSVVVGLTHGTRTTLRVGREGSRATGRYRFSGRVSFQGGAIGQSTVNIIATGKASDESEQETGSQQSKIVLVTSTDKDGVYLGAIGARELFTQFTGTIRLQAVAVPDPTRYTASRSSSIQVTVPAGHLVPSHWYAWALAWVLGLLVLVQLVRTRAWSKLVVWLRALRARHSRSALNPALGDFIELNVDDSAPRRPGWLAGRVFDRYAGHPVAGVEVTINREEAGTVRACTTDKEGRFDLGQIEPGAWEFVLSMPGYHKDSSLIRFPHEGGLDGARFTLTSLKHSARLAFAEKLKTAGYQWKWGYETIRDALVGVARSGDASLKSEGYELEAAWYKPSGDHSGTTPKDGSR